MTKINPTPTCTDISEVDLTPELDKSTKTALCLDTLARFETRGYARLKSLADVFIAALGKSERNMLRVILQSGSGVTALRVALGIQNRTPRAGSKQAASESLEDYRTRLGAESRTIELFKTQQ